jgi:2'-5' RNA ligase
MGITLAVPSPWAEQVQDYRVAVGDVTGHQVPAHITLVPPAEVDAGQVPAVMDHLQWVSRRSVPFDITLRGTGTFRPVSPVVFVALAAGISSCERLATEVRFGPLSVPLTYPYHPHVTLAQHVAEETLDRAFEDFAHFSCTFNANSFLLYAHDDDSGWQPKQEFPLAGTSS